MIFAEPGANSKLAIMRTRKGFSGRSDLAFRRAQRSAMRAREPEFNQHRVAFCGDGNDLVGLIGKRYPRSGEVAAYSCLTVEHRPGTVQLVARMREGGDDAIPVALAFEPHMVAHGLDARGG